MNDLIVRFIPKSFEITLAGFHGLANANLNQENDNIFGKSVTPQFSRMMSFYEISNT